MTLLTSLHFFKPLGRITFLHYSLKAAAFYRGNKSKKRTEAKDNSLKLMGNKMF